MRRDYLYSVAFPLNQMRVSTFKPRTEEPDVSFDLKVYKRVLLVCVKVRVKIRRFFLLQLSEIESPTLSLLLDQIRATQPQGATLAVKEFNERDHDVRCGLKFAFIYSCFRRSRYLPNKDLEEAYAELASYDNVAVRRKKGWLIE